MAVVRLDALRKVYPNGYVAVADASIEIASGDSGVQGCDKPSRSLIEAGTLQHSRELVGRKGAVSDLLAQNCTEGVSDFVVSVRFTRQLVHLTTVVVADQDGGRSLSEVNPARERYPCVASG